MFLALGCAAVAVVAVDAALLLIWGRVRFVEDFYEPSLRFGYRMRPHLEFQFASPYHGYRATVRTNSRGLRDDEVAVPKPQGRFRVLLLGDSMTAGLEVEKQETFEAVCERCLRRHGDVEVINAGVRGYNADNVVLFLEHEGCSYGPDVVVYMFVDNDMPTSMRVEPATTDPSHGFTVSGFLGRLSTWSHLAYRLQLLTQMRALRAQGDGRAVMPGTRAYPGGILEILSANSYDELVFAPMVARVARMRDLATGVGAELLLIGAPQQELIDPETQRWWTRHLKSRHIDLDFDGMSAFMAWIGARDSVQVLDVIEAFRREFAPERWLWFHRDTHMNARGHRIVGEQLAARIETLQCFEAWRRRAAAQRSGGDELRRD